MKVAQDGQQVIVALTASEAAEIEDELLWIHEENNPALMKLWEALQQVNDAAGMG